ncbi:hypothetical protein ZWY2020_001877 [Hordeum vulgare]|nr:hypothetical protein ZWY2020_001877 [Hordeum vulgare]
MLFEDRQEPLLPSPALTPPQPSVASRKILAGINIIRISADLSPHMTSARLKVAGKTRVPPALADKDGEDITAKALDAFAERFKERLPQEVIFDMCELFKIDDVQATGVKDALIQHGGEGAMDVGRMEDPASM